MRALTDADASVDTRTADTVRLDAHAVRPGFQHGEPFSQVAGGGGGRQADGHDGDGGDDEFQVHLGIYCFVLGLVRMVFVSILNRLGRQLLVN